MRDGAVDEDTRAVIETLREAVRDSGLTQSAFTHGMGTSAARFSGYLGGASRPSAYFVLRAQRLGRALAAAAEQGLWSSSVAGLEIRKLVVAHEETASIWRLLLRARADLQRILSSDAPALIASWELRPVETGGRRWDTLLAAVTAHEFEAAGQSAPEWTAVEPLDSPWLPAHPLMTADPQMTLSRLEEQTPDWLARFNILVPERHLAITG